MKKVLSLIFTLSSVLTPALAWGGGDCPLKDKTNHEAETEQLDESDQ